MKIQAKFKQLYLEHRDPETRSLSSTVAHVYNNLLNDHERSVLRRDFHEGALGSGRATTYARDGSVEVTTIPFADVITALCFFVSA